MPYKKIKWEIIVVILDIVIYAVFLNYESKSWYALKSIYVFNVLFELLQLQWKKLINYFPINS